MSGITSQAPFYQKKPKPNCWQRDSEAFVMPAAKRAPRCDLIRCHVLTRYFMEGFCSLYGRQCISGILASESGLNSVLVDALSANSSSSLAINLFCCWGCFFHHFCKSACDNVINDYATCGSGTRKVLWGGSHIKPYRTGVQSGNRGTWCSLVLAGGMGSVSWKGQRAWEKKAGATGTSWSCGEDRMTDPHCTKCVW